MTETWDVVVVGGGNAGFAAAHAARERGAEVLVLEKAPRAWAGGNSYFTAGAMRVVHGGLDDLAGLVDGLPAERRALVDLDPYPAEEFLADLRRITRGRTDPRLADLLVGQSREVVDWLRDKGIRFELMFHRQAYQVDGRFRFWGGLVLGVVGGGKGLIAQHLAAAEDSGVQVRFDSPVTGLLQDERGSVTGVRVSTSDGPVDVGAGSVVLASGGFEANPRLRAGFLGPGWDLALVRGTPYNTGDGIELAMSLGAAPHGNWSGCHSVAWDAAAPAVGDLGLTNQLTRGGYPFGIVVNTAGERFLDEGADFRNYTYARYGAEILKQPDGVAVQVFDAKVAHLLRPEEYAAPGVSRIEADTLDGLAKEVGSEVGMDESRFLRTVAEFNAAVTRGRFDPTIKDGKSAVGLSPAKSNWAQPLDTPPYQAFPVTCGITFTFGGLHVDDGARVLDRSGRTIPGLYAAGELVGGLFYFNYPGGSGLTAGSVFGRLAGWSAVADRAPCGSRSAADNDKHRQGGRK